MQQKCTLFPDRLKTLREKENLSRQQLADILGVSRASLEYYEKGKRTPDIEVLYKLSEYFNVTADYLIGRTDKSGESTDVNAICKYTGLSEKSVNILNDVKSTFEYVEVINFLIEEINYRKTDKGNAFSDNLIDWIKSYYFYNCGVRKKQEQYVCVTSLGHIYTSLEQFESDSMNVIDDFYHNKKFNEMKLNFIPSSDLLDSYFENGIVEHIKESKKKFITKEKNNGND